MYENKELCSKCGGKCCKRMPGACFPEDFGLPWNQTKLHEALASGQYAIDWWIGDPREEENELDETRYVRPAIKGKAGKRYDQSCSGECVFLSKTGCMLEEDERPLNCQKLEPKKDGKCVLRDDADKQGAAIAWIPYQHMLR